MSRAVDVLPCLGQSTFESCLVTGEISRIERDRSEQIRMMVEVSHHSTGFGHGYDGTVVELDQSHLYGTVEKLTSEDLLVIDTVFLSTGLVLDVPGDRVSEIHMQAPYSNVFIRSPKEAPVYLWGKLVL